MAGRREFVKHLGLGALSSLAFTALARGAEQTAPPLNTGTGKRVRVGVIGAENSHTVGFGQIFNKDKKFPGVEITALWGETAEFARNAADKGGIPKVVEKQSDLIGQIDALIVDHRHPKYHVEAALPFVEAGIPTFVDKPFSYRTYDAWALLEAAEKRKTPITCLSSIACGPAVEDMRQQVQALKDIRSVIVTGPAEIDSKYGGIFFYGVHSVELLFKLAGYDCEAVRATRLGPNTTFEFKFASGLLATYVVAKKWEVICVTDDGAQTIKSRLPGEDPLAMYAMIVKMFQTGAEPRTHESIIRGVAALEAMERSVYTEEWELLLV
jgi:predicted dehydrogenase